jgi:hypothetical protein
MCLSQPWTPTSIIIFHALGSAVINAIGLSSGVRGQKPNHSLQSRRVFGYSRYRCTFKGDVIDPQHYSIESLIGALIVPRYRPDAAKLH